MTTTLTPAEELGLGGLSLDSRVRRIFYGIPPQTLSELTERMVEEAFKRRLVYLRDGQTEAIHVFLRPTGIMPDQYAYLHFVTLTLVNAIKRLPELYIQDFAIREVVPLTPPEEKWLWDSFGPSQREYNPVFGRLDALVDFTSPMWKDTLRFVEPNLCGVGGIHLVPTCEQMLVDVVLPVLQTYDADLHLEAGQDLRELFIEEMLDHLDSIGWKGRNVCFIEPKYSGDGPDEQTALAEFYRDRYGLTVLHADPSDLYMKKGGVWYEDSQVDIAYRDYEVRDIIELEEEGIDIRPMRTLFKENRMVSALAGDFDHKSCWEILTDPQFTQKYFNPDERQVFRRHVLWTRKLSDRRTSLPDGEQVDLLEHTRAYREELVIKPNRSYGGDRVLIGPSVSQSEWESAIEEALEDEEDEWVVQRLAPIAVNEFPVVADDGSVHIEPFYTVMGFAPTKYGLAVLGRASQKQVVNVAQRGGMCGVLIGKPSGRLRGPAAQPRLV